MVENWTGLSQALAAGPLKERRSDRSPKDVPQQLEDWDQSVSDL
jgi:hypothetical protein